MADRVHWGIIGLGSIARLFAKDLKQSKTGTLVAVGSRTQEKAHEFGDAFEVSIPKRYATYEALLADCDVDAVYIATPHPMHAQWVIAAAEAGKHILCEKPIGINHAETVAMVEAAKCHDVFLMEAFMYRCHPQTKKMLDLIDAGYIGEVRVIEAMLGYHQEFNQNSRVFANHLGGGGILDIGCYTVSVARLVAGRALGCDFAEPIDVQGVGHLCQTGVDGWTAATLRFERDIIAQVATAVEVRMESRFRIWGSAGDISVPSVYVPGRDSDDVVIYLNCGNESKTIRVQSDAPLYSLEADVLARDLALRQGRWPAMSWDDSLGNMRTLDRWRQAIGFSLNQDEGFS